MGGLGSSNQPVNICGVGFAVRLHRPKPTEPPHPSEWLKISLNDRSRGRDISAPDERPGHRGGVAAIASGTADAGNDAEAVAQAVSALVAARFKDDTYLQVQRHAPHATSSAAELAESMEVHAFNKNGGILDGSRVWEYLFDLSNSPGLVNKAVEALARGEEIEVRRADTDEEREFKAALGVRAKTLIETSPAVQQQRNITAEELCRRLQEIGRKFCHADPAKIYQHIEQFVDQNVLEHPGRSQLIVDLSNAVRDLQKERVPTSGPTKRHR